MKPQILKKIKEVMEKEIKPMLVMHLGDVDVVNYQKGTVTVRLQGTCKGCPLSKITLKHGIEEILKAKIHEVKKVEEII